MGARRDRSFILELQSLRPGWKVVLILLGLAITTWIVSTGGEAEIARRRRKRLEKRQLHSSLSLGADDKEISDEMVSVLYAAGCRTRTDVLALDAKAVAAVLGGTLAEAAEFVKRTREDAEIRELSANFLPDDDYSSLDLSLASAVPFPQRTGGLKLETCSAGVAVVLASFGSSGDNDQTLGVVRAAESGTDYSTAEYNGWCIKRGYQNAQLGGGDGARESTQAPDDWRLGERGQHAEVTMVFDRAKRRACFWRGFTVAGTPTTVIDNLPDEDLAPFVGKYHNQVTVKCAVGQELQCSMSRSLLGALCQAGCRTEADVLALSGQAIAAFPNDAREELAEYLLREPLGQTSSGMSAKTLAALLQAGCRTKADVVALSARGTAALGAKASGEVAAFVTRERIEREEPKKKAIEFQKEHAGDTNWLYYDASWKNKGKREQPTEFYHVTDYDAAMSIQENGFRPSSGGTMGAGVCKCNSSLCGFANCLKERS